MLENMIDLGTLRFDERARAWALANPIDLRLYLAQSFEVVGDFSTSVTVESNRRVVDSVTLAERTGGTIVIYEFVSDCCSILTRSVFHIRTVHRVKLKSQYRHLTNS